MHTHYSIFHFIDKHTFNSQFFLTSALSPEKSLKAVMHVTIIAPGMIYLGGELLIHFSQIRKKELVGKWDQK